MIVKNYLLISLRNLLKNKVYIGINVFGMGVAIACCIIAYLNFRMNAFFDAEHVHTENVYRISTVREVAEQEQNNAALPVPLGRIIKENNGDVEAVIRFSPSYAQFTLNGEFFPAQMAYVDPVLFKVFTFRFISGKPEALNNKSAIFLSEKMCRKLFGTTDAIGKTVQQVLNSGEIREFEVAGLFEDQPSTSSFQRSAYVNYDNYFHEFSSGNDHWTSFNNVFVKIDRPERIEAFEKQLQGYTEPSNRAENKFRIKRFYLESFAGMAQRDAGGDALGALTSGSTPYAIILTLVIMSVLILSIACFNLTNTLLAISTRRLKEIGLRKVMGSVRIQLILQFIGESVLICLFSVLVGLGICDLLVLAWNEMWPFLKLEMNLLENIDILLFLTAVVLITGSLSGAYPAFYVSKFQAAQILKGKVEIGGTSYFTRLLLMLQFAVSVIALFFSIAFYQNSLYQKNFDFGFLHNDVLVVPVKDEEEFDKLRNTLVHEPDVLSVAGSADHLFSSRSNQPVNCNGIEIRADILRVGEDYRETMGFELLEGRDFNASSKNDRKESVIITKNLAENLGTGSALDKTIIIDDSIRLYVVGVVKDIYTRGLWHEKEPMVLRLTGEERYDNLIIRTAEGESSSVNEYMQQRWSELFPGRPYFGRPMNEIMNYAEDVNKNLITIFTFLASLALLLSVAGLYSTVSLNIARRMKEVGVRKIFGASIAQIIWTTNIQFMVILVLSSLAGCLAGNSLSTFMMDKLWDYFQPASVLTYVIATGIVLWLACVMIGSKVYHAASANPILSLKEE